MRSLRLPEGSAGERASERPLSAAPWDGEAFQYRFLPARGRDYNTKAVSSDHQRTTASSPEGRDTPGG